MTYNELRELCRRGKVGRIPKWVGYVKYNCGSEELLFVNGDYIMPESELKSKIGNRTDLYYII